MDRGPLWTTKGSTESALPCVDGFEWRIETNKEKQRPHRGRHVQINPNHKSREITVQSIIPNLIVPLPSLRP